MSSKLIVNNEWLGPDFVFTVSDAREVRVSVTGETVCLKGIKQFCVSHGFDYQLFRKVGIEASRIVETGDIRAQVAVLKIYRKRRASSGRRQ